MNWKMGKEMKNEKGEYLEGGFRVKRDLLLRVDSQSFGISAISQWSLHLRALIEFPNGGVLAPCKTLAWYSYTQCSGVILSLNDSNGETWEDRGIEFVE